jgi:hypothetical protein
MEGHLLLQMAFFIVILSAAKDLLQAAGRPCEGVEDASFLSMTKGFSFT